MLSSIVRFSIRFRGIVISLACLLAGYGIYTLYRATLDVFPEFAPPLAIIQTEAPGLSTEQVEALVTQPIENAMGGTLGLKTMRSKSLQGLSMVSMTFRGGMDVYRARQLASERLGAVVGKLPRGVKPPALLPLSSSTSVAMIIGLTSDVRSPMELHDIAEWTLRPQLLGLPGVADVVVFGGETPDGITLRVGKFGPYLESSIPTVDPKTGELVENSRANVPEDLAPGAAQLEHGALERSGHASRKGCVLHRLHCTHGRALRRPQQHEPVTPDFA